MIKHSRQQIRLLYHWWNDDLSVKPHKDLANPIVLSIATVRAHNWSIPITVIDVSSEERKEDWKEYSSILNFDVVHWKPLLDQNLHKSSRLCSRVWDIWSYSQLVKEGNILFTDCDIFWIKNPLPLSKANNERLDDFYCSSNTGVWYFDKRSERVKKTIQLWKSIISNVLIGDKDFYDDLSEIVPSAKQFFQDEVAFGYLILKYPELYSPVDMYENFIVDRLRYTEYDFSKIKAIHMLSATLGQMRGRVCLILSELKRSLEKIFSKEQIDDIFNGVNSETEYSVDDVKSISSKELRDFVSFTGNSGCHIPNVKPSDNYGYFVKELGIDQ